MSKRLKEIRFNLVAWLIAGNMFVIFRFFGMYDFEQYFILKKPIEMELMFLEANVVAVVNGLLLSLVDMLFDTPKFKRESFRYILTVKSLAYIVTMFVSIVSIFVLHGILTNRDNNLLYSLNYTLNSQYTLALYLYGAFISLLINFLKEVNKKFGPGILVKLFSGRYYNPRVEERIFMFIDLKASTTIAEKLGHIKYSRLIQDCFYDVTDVVAMYKAEIYQYVGDEIVLTWELENGIENDNCFKFFFEFKKKLESLSDYYKDKYGVVPVFKAGMNCGTVTVAEIGELKKEIAYHGDVLNTASRIQDQCNEHNKPFLISSNMYRKIPRTGLFRIDLIGEILLKGKLNPVAIYSVDKCK
ncbi:MAG TPA: adenylate/guanylate cyclase domain-containing protein [Ignavibacteria bacterium]|nr:adenylate/guanylate cyclase domain-containing protein [Ignavibacteria bacterium]